MDELVRRDSPAPPNATRTARPPLFAWFAGVDMRLLAQTPSEWSFYDALGKTVFLLACGSGLAMAVAAGYMLDVSASHVAWLGIVWTAIVSGGIERLVLQLPSTKKRWLPVVLIPRLALSLLLAVQLGEPLMLKINEGEISNFLSTAKVTATHAAIAKAENEFKPIIKADNDAIAAIQAKEKALQDKIEHYRFLSACEKDTPSCSHTGMVGCATYCQHYAHLAAQAEAQLDARKPHDTKTIKNLRADIAAKTNAMNGEIGSRQNAIDSDTGLLAREHALASLEKASPEVAAEVWFLRLLFITLDLLPLAAKVLRPLTTELPYEALADAARRNETLGATRMNEAARVEERRILDQARADIEVNKIRINLDMARRIDEAEGVWNSAPGGQRPAA
jgi:hypothetical protein